MKIYLAHPISGLSGPQVITYYEDMHAFLSAQGWEVLQPMTGKGEMRTEKKFKADGNFSPVASNHAIFERDQWMVRSADVVLVDLYGARDVSIGCLMELAWAAALHKHTVVVMEQENPHRHAFVLEAADILLETQAGAREYLTRLVKGRM